MGNGNACWTLWSHVQLMPGLMWWVSHSLSFILSFCLIILLIWAWEVVIWSSYLLKCLLSMILLVCCAYFLLDYFLDWIMNHGFLYFFLFVRSMTLLIWTCNLGDSFSENAVGFWCLVSVLCQTLDAEGSFPIYLLCGESCVPGQLYLLGNMLWEIGFGCHSCHGLL